MNDDNGFGSDKESTYNRRFATGRPELPWGQTKPLEKPVTLTGYMRVHLKASTTGALADWAIKPIDTASFYGFTLQGAICWALLRPFDVTGGGGHARQTPS